MKTSEIIKEVKGLKVKELIKFKKQFDKYYMDIIESLGGTVSVSATPVQVAPIAAPVNEQVEQPVATTEVKKKWTIGKNSNWKNFFAGVEEINTEMGDTTKKEGIILSAKKDTNVGTVAALVGHRGKVVNMVWGTCYELPVLFAKCTKAELKEYANQILANPPAGYQPAKHLANGQFYYDELEAGNFICKIYDKDAGVFKHFGYMVDQDVVFYVNSNGDIECNGLKHYFVKKWGHRPKKEAAILGLLARADFKEAETKNEYADDSCFNQFSNNS